MIGIVSDTLEVFIEDLATSNLYFFGATSETSIARKMKTEFLRGGFGSFIQGAIRSESEMTAKVTPLLFSEDVLGLQMGQSFASGTKTVKKSEGDLVISAGKVTIVGTPVGTAIDIFDAQGKKYVGVFTTGQVTITTPPASGIVTAVYNTSVTGNFIDLRADSFPLAYKVHMHGIFYNPDSNAIMADTYWAFTKAQPSGEVNLQFGSKNVQTPIDFTMMCPLGSKSYGFYVNVPRA